MSLFPCASSSYTASVFPPVMKGMPLRLAGIIRESIVDGSGLRFAVFAQGCPHRCPGCHNPQTHDFEGGKEVSSAQIIDEIRKNPLLQGVTFTGGEPFCQPMAFAELGLRIKALPNKLDITVFSGFTYEELIRKAATDQGVLQLLETADYLIDGPYLEAQRDLTLPFRGSRNQRYIDLVKTRLAGTVVLASERKNPNRGRYVPSLRYSI